MSISLFLHIIQLLFLNQNELVIKFIIIIQFKIIIIIIIRTYLTHFHLIKNFLKYFIMKIIVKYIPLLFLLFLLFIKNHLIFMHNVSLMN